MKFCSPEESRFSNKIIELMRVREITPSIYDVLARHQILEHLNEIVHTWVIDVAQSWDLEPESFSAEVACHGSFRLQAYLPSSDLDVVVIGPSFTSELHFFEQLFEMIRRHPNTSKARCIKGAKVPFIKFWMYEVAVDVTYSRIDCLRVPKEEALKDENFCIEKAAGRSLLLLNSVAANYNILKCVRGKEEMLKLAIQFLKQWAKCRGIYGNKIGYIGGIHLSVMVAYVCKKIPFPSLARIISCFFAIYSLWKWESPIILEEDSTIPVLPVPPIPMIQIQIPGTSVYCLSNVNSTTLKRINDELKIGAATTKVLSGWSSLLENYRYDLNHTRFLRIYTSATNETKLDQWIEFLKSRFLTLVDCLKKHADMECDPNLIEYMELTSDPHRVFLWGIIEKKKSVYYDLSSTINSWRNILVKKQDTIETIDLSVVPLRAFYNNFYRVESKATRLPVEILSSALASLYSRSPSQKKPTAEIQGEVFASTETEPPQFTSDTGGDGASCMFGGEGIGERGSIVEEEPSEEPFDINSVPKEVKSQQHVEKKSQTKKPSGLGALLAAPTSITDAYEKLLSSIPEFSSFGKLFKSSTPVELTEAETEYAVNAIKHIFDGHVVFQYNCTNTIPEQLLENVSVIVDASEAEKFSEVAIKPIRSLPYDSPGQTFVAFEKPVGVTSFGRFSNTLKFIVKKVDTSSGEAEDDGVEDEYQLEDLEVVAADYILKVGVSNFKNAWESLDPDCERVDEHGLGPRETLAEAITVVNNLLGMQPCEGTEIVPKNARSHTCLLSGIYIGNFKVLVRVSFGFNGPKEVAMKLAVRSDDISVSEAIHEIVASG